MVAVLDVRIMANSDIVAIISMVIFSWVFLFGNTLFCNELSHLVLKKIEPASHTMKYYL